MALYEPWRFRLASTPLSCASSRTHSTLARCCRWLPPRYSLGCCCDMPSFTSVTDPRFCWACGAPAIEREIDHYLRNVCTGCGKILYRNPAPAAGCVVETDGAVLLARRKFEPWQGHWYIPSG